MLVNIVVVDLEFFVSCIFVVFCSLVVFDKVVSWFGDCIVSGCYILVVEVE